MDNAETRPTFKREVPEVLDEIAAVKLADQATRTATRANELEDELKEHTTKVKATIKELRGQAERDHAASEKRTRMVVADCYEELRGSQMFVIRADTGAVVDQRAATLAERQQDFPGLDRGGALPRPGTDDGDDEGEGDDGPEPVITTPPGGAPKLEGDPDGELEPDYAASPRAPKSETEKRTRAKGKGKSKGRR